MHDPLDMPNPATVQGELRALARVICTALGIVLAYWNAQRMPDNHPYRLAALTVRTYLERRYG